MFLIYFLNTYKYEKGNFSTACTNQVAATPFSLVAFQIMCT